MLRLEKPQKSTLKEPLTFNEFKQVKLSLHLSLRFFKKLMALGFLAPLNEALEEVDRMELLVFTKILYQSF